MKSPEVITNRYPSSGERCQFSKQSLSPFKGCLSLFIFATAVGADPGMAPPSVVEGAPAAARGASSALSDLARAYGVDPERVLVLRGGEGRFGSRPLVETGSVLPRWAARVASKGMGQVTSATVERGDSVRAGDVLVQLDDALVRHQLDEARAGEALARAQLEELEAGTRPEDLAAARASLDEARAEEVRASKEMARLEELARKRAATPSQYDRATAALGRARAQVARLEALLVRARQGPRKEVLAQARARLAQAEARTAQARQRVEDSRVVAPFDAVVVEKLVEPGAHVKTGEPVVRLADLSRLEMEVAVPEEALVLLSREGEVRVRLDGASKAPVAGRILRISPTVDPRTRRGVVEIQLVDPPAEVRPGMFGRVLFLHP